MSEKLTLVLQILATVICGILIFNTKSFAATSCRSAFLDLESDSRISSEELIAISSYARNGAWGVNSALRAGIPIEDKINCPGCLQLQSALKKVKKYVGLVFRRVRFPDDDILQNYLIKGEIVEDPAFVSTSRSYFSSPALREHSRGERGVIMVIRSRTGRDLSSIGLNFEREVLFLAGAKFRVRLALPKLGGGYLIFLDEV